MNIENISALTEQLQSLGFENAGYPLLKRISFKPDSFTLSQKIDKSKDKLSFQLFFEKEGSKDMYVLLYYDAILQKDTPLIDPVINGINSTSLEKSMTEIDWKSAFDFVTKKPLNLEDKTTWEKEQKVESVIESLSELEKSEDGKAVAVGLKLKYWAGIPYQEVFGNITPLKNKSEVSQRFYVFEGQPGISVDEAYAGDAYQMISTLRKLGVEPQAIEQPLDLAIPENKLMLAFYLAAPEVENDRRALNVTYGMKKARKEGRWMGKAPLGYINKITEDGKKYIAPKEPGANILKWAFHTIAKGQYQVEQIYKEVNNKGFTVCKSGFWNLLRNPVYCGKILTCGYRELHKTYVPGQHEAIISEALFNEVQDFLDGKKKNYRTKVGSLEVLQLRGFIKCPRCGKLLTGSASCGSRFKSEQANELFAGELKKYIPRPDMTEVFKLVINEVYLAKTKKQKTKKTKSRT